MRSGVALALLLVLCTSVRSRYVGRSLGRLSELHHGVRGHVYAVDSRTLYIQDLHYDGEGPAAYFYVGSSKTPNAVGATRLRDERGGTGPLRRYRGEGVTLSLPDSITLHDVKWFALWCDEYAVNFGDVSIPRDLEYPKPAKVGSLRGVHGVSSDPIVVVDAQTLLVPNFSYDGEAPDAKFWVGRGDKPSPQGIRIPDENGKEAPLRKYDKKTIVLTLPGELTVFDIGHFAVWCEAFTVNFGHVTLPHDQLANVPPSLKMLGVSPQNRNKALAADAGKTPTRRRKPITRVDATTYRPHRLGTGPIAGLLDQPTDHSAHLHRRADDYKPANEQLVQIEKSKEIIQKDHIEPEKHSHENKHHVNNEQYQIQNQNYQVPGQQNLQEDIQQLIYQQQIYEQQIMAYQQELLAAQHQPVYRLLPYSYQEGRG